MRLISKVFVEFVTVSFLFCVLVFFGHKTCGILVPHSGIKPTSPTLEGKVLNQRTTREVPQWAPVNTVVVPSVLTIVLLSTWLQSTEKNQTYFDIRSKKQVQGRFRLLRWGNEAAWAHIPAPSQPTWDLTPITYSLLASPHPSSGRWGY